MVANVYSETAAVSQCLSNWVLWLESSVFWFPSVFHFFCLWITIIMYHESYFCIYKYITYRSWSIIIIMVDSLKVGIFGAGGNLLTLLAVPWAQVFSQFLIYFHRKSLSWDPGPRIVLPLLSLRWDLNDVILAVEDINSAHLFFFMSLLMLKSLIGFKDPIPRSFYH